MLTTLHCWFITTFGVFSRGAKDIAWTAKTANTGVGFLTKLANTPEETWIKIALILCLFVGIVTLIKLLTVETVLKILVINILICILIMALAVIMPQIAKGLAEKFA